MIGEILKKVVVQYSRDARKQLGIDILLAEYLVHIGSAARQLAGKPGDTALLGLQSLSNKFPYRFHGLQKTLLSSLQEAYIQQTKRGTEHSYRSLKAVGKTRDTDMR